MESGPDPADHGASMPFVFVTISTVAVSTVVARRVQFHCAHLVEHISDYNATFRHLFDAMTSAVAHRGMGLYAARQSALAVIDGLVSRQDTMLAYNDTAWIMGLLFLLTVPMVLLLPRRHRLAP